jgi:hypothetical protein
MDTQSNFTPGAVEMPIVQSQDNAGAENVAAESFIPRQAR